MEEDFGCLFISADSQVGRIEVENSEAVHQDSLNRDDAREVLVLGVDAQFTKLQQLLVKGLYRKHFFQQTQ